MAKPYFEQLEKLVKECELVGVRSNSLEVKHFFSGAALYSGGTICSSLSPMGLAFKLSDVEADKLIKSGRAVPLKYFKKGNIKKGYVMFKSPNLNQIKRWKGYFLKALEATANNGT
jgi:hypothetical protein